MADPQIAAWVKRNSGIFDELQVAVTSVAESARAARLALQGGVSEPVELLTAAGDRARDLLVVVRRGQALEPIPDETAETPWAAGLARWADAAETIVAAAARRDAEELHRGGRAIEAGTEEFLRSAAAFRAAS